MLLRDKNRVKSFRVLKERDGGEVDGRGKTIEELDGKILTPSPASPDKGGGFEWHAHSTPS